MDPLTQALRGARHDPGRGGATPHDAALVVGAGGTLGSALLAEALAGARFRRVAAVVTGPLASALRGFVPLALSALEGRPEPLGIELAFVVFERARHANGRDENFLQPDPAQLLPLARVLHARGVRRLLVVVPHTAALLPQALKAGLATLDEAAVAALGFEHLVFVRASQPGATDAGGSWLQRLAAAWLAQLHWMVPQREQPLRAQRLAELVVQLARRLAASPAGTRVLPPELLWQAAREPDADALFDAWLAGHG